MVAAHSNQFIHSVVILENGAASFKCSDDVLIWPWLGLPPSNPIVVQTIHYWAATEIGQARGTLDPEKWTALTQMKWECHATRPNSKHASHGLMMPSEPSAEGKPEPYQLVFFDEDGNLVYHMSAIGVVFRTRNFEAWREEAKQKNPQTSAGVFKFAPPELTGVATETESYLSHLIGGDVPSADALITKETGIAPTHPYHSGSGDHVNANHLVDVGMQFAHLLCRTPHRCTGGEISFRRYVELGRPFRLAKTDMDEEPGAISISVHQHGKKCTDMRFTFS